jgi:hypothetical protein
VFWLTKFSLSVQKENNLQFYDILATKNGGQEKFSPSSFGAVVGSGIRDG